ncbi:MAG: ATP-grasp domain-containing protein [Emcibacter sp.]|nr:ATP-grasp domain-containing protein [Emcibacter sp.]
MSDLRELFLFIESNTSGTGELFAHTAYELGYAPVLVGEDPQKYAYANKPWLQLETCDTYNRIDLERLAKRLGQTARIAGVFSSSEYFIAKAAALAAALGLPAADAAKIEECRNKAIQRQTVSTLGIDNLHYVVARTSTDAAEWAASMAHPVVVKPTRGSGSCDVKLCKTPSEVRSHAKHLLSTSPEAPFLVEEFSPGQEYSVELFDGEVCGVVGKHLGSQPHFVETGHDFPARISAELSDQLGQFAQDCAAAMGITWGPAHVEVRSDGAQIHLVEVNPRLAGGFIPLMIRAATGLNLIENSILKAAGRNFSCFKPKSGSAALRFIVLRENGVLAAVTGLDAAKEFESIVSAQVYLKTPANVQQHHDFRDRIGHLLAVDPDQGTAIADVEAATSRVSLCYQNGTDAPVRRSEGPLQ